MKTIVFATNNSHKLEEVRAIVSGTVNIVSLSDIGCNDDIPETADTLEGNALLKARFVKDRYGYDCFADDTGLEVEALDGKPGVYSARYAGEECDSNANMDKLLNELRGKQNRKARFRTVIALIMNDKEEYYEGVVNGRIIEEKRGKTGFGYDPVFMPDGYDETFAELGTEIKNNISHRAIAVKKFAESRGGVCLSILFFLLFSLSVFAQNNKWTTHLAYHEATGIAETNERVYVVANGALFSYGKEDQEKRLYSKQNGLSDTDIKIIKYSPDNHILVIVYSNGNIDLFSEDGIKNMPHLKNATNVQSKNVNDIYFYGRLAYLSTDFGIMVINLEREEVTDTYRLSKTVNSVCIMGDNIIASTDDGLWQAATKDNLPDAGVWKKKILSEANLNGNTIKRIQLFNNQLFFCVEKDGIYYENAEGEIKNILKQNYIKDITVQAGELLAYTSDDNLYIFTSVNNYSYVKTGTINSVASLKADGKYWVASGANGLIGVQRAEGNNFEVFVSNITINSPKRNYNVFMTIFDNRKLLIAGGDRMWARSWRPGTLMIYENDTWYNFDEMVVNNETVKLFGEYTRDYMGIAVDPDDENHYFIPTYGEGVVELKDNKFVKLHHLDNSTLKSSAINDPTYVRVGSACFDNEKNLWVTNCLAQNIINILKANGEWISLYYAPISNADKIDKILITSRGHKWINVPYDNAGIFVLDDNKTIEDTSDDKFRYYTTFRDALSNTGGNIPASEYLCMTEDTRGTIWIGTNTGILKCSNTSDIENLSCSRLVRDGDAYFLSSESVTAIAVDADNQKWIGTASQGVFLINEDGSETILNFNTDNSPLLSNTINSIAVNKETGEVFIGTANGLISYSSGVRSGVAPFSDVYAFPNPVRPEYNDMVTITGLVNNASVKITDMNGNLIYQGHAIGNQMIWNCRNSRGNRVATGVYLVLAATQDASESVVTKIAVVK